MELGKRVQCVSVSVLRECVRVVPDVDKSTRRKAGGA
jgi:hypothetical protein